MSSQQWLDDTLRLDVECGLCGYAGPADGWEDPEVMKWGWDCPSCDFPHTFHADVERGATTVAAAIFTLGFLLAAGSLASLFFTIPTAVHLAVSLAGVALMLLPLTAAAITWLTQNGHTK